MLAGEVVSEPSTRNTPAGIPIMRFTLQHRSVQCEAGNARKAECRIIVVACGDNVQTGLKTGAHVVVEGFLSYESRRQMETRLVIHAHSIKVMNKTD